MDKVIATLLSLWLPGMGQAYLGEIRKARLIVLAFGFVAFVYFPLLLALPGQSAGVARLLLIFGALCAQLVFAVQAWRSATRGKDGLWAKLCRCGVHFLFLLLGLVCVKAQRRFGVDSYLVSSESMFPTLIPGDELVAVKWVSRGELRRGDIVVFAERDVVFLHRIVGLPGDRIELRNGSLVLNGSEIPRAPSPNCGVELAQNQRCFEETLGDRRYFIVMLELTPAERLRRDGEMMPYAHSVPSDHLFLVGDNRDNSFDSRFKRSVPMSAVIGRPVKIYHSKTSERRGRRVE